MLEAIKDIIGLLALFGTIYAGALIGYGLGY